MYANCQTGGINFESALGGCRAFAIMSQRHNKSQNYTLKSTEQFDCGITVLYYEL
jgi:hypothetical protein